jgi:hypothetical protein
MFLQNIVTYLKVHMVLQPRRRTSTTQSFFRAPSVRCCVSPDSVTNSSILETNQPIFVQLNMITMTLKHSLFITLFKIPTQKSTILTWSSCTLLRYKTMTSLYYYYQPKPNQHIDWQLRRSILQHDVPLQNCSISKSKRVKMPMRCGY